MNKSESKYYNTALLMDEALLLLLEENIIEKEIRCGGGRVDIVLVILEQQAFVVSELVLVRKPVCLGPRDQHLPRCSQSPVGPEASPALPKQGSPPSSVTRSLAELGSSGAVGGGLSLYGLLARVLLQFLATWALPFGPLQDGASLHQ